MSTMDAMQAFVQRTDSDSGSDSDSDGKSERHTPSNERDSLGYS